MEDKLKQITERLEKLIVEMEFVGMELAEMQYHLEQRKAEIYMSELVMGYRNAEAREAQVKLILEQEGMNEPVMRKRSEFAKLTNEKELLIEVSRNLRELLRLTN